MGAPAVFRFSFLHWHFYGKIPDHPEFFPLISCMGYRFFPLSEIVSPHDCEVGIQGNYPAFKVTYTDEELAEHFLLTRAERALVDTRRGEVNRHGMAVLLKTVQYLGYFPAEPSHVPEVVRTFIAHQLQHARCACGVDSAAHGLSLSDWRR